MAASPVGRGLIPVNYVIPLDGNMAKSLRISSSYHAGSRSPPVAHSVRRVSPKTNYTDQNKLI